MASTNETAGYQLNQWVKTDPVLMADFNADNLKIDTVLSGLAGSVAAVAASVSAMADSAVQMITGTYTGTGTYGRSSQSMLSFAKPPKLLVIGSTKRTTSANGIYQNMAVIFPLGGGGFSTFPNFSDNGSSSGYTEGIAVTVEGGNVSWYSYTSQNQTNTNGMVYSYLAIV